MQTDFHRAGSEMLRVRSSRLQTGSESVDPNKRKLQSGIAGPERILHKRLQRTSLEWYQSLILIVLYQPAYLHFPTRTRVLIHAQISVPKMCPVAIGDPSPDRGLNQSLCNVNMF